MLLKYRSENFSCFMLIWIELSEVVDNSCFEPAPEKLRNKFHCTGNKCPWPERNGGGQHFLFYHVSCQASAFLSGNQERPEFAVSVDCSVNKSGVNYGHSNFVLCEMMTDAFHVCG